MISSVLSVVRKVLPRNQFARGVSVLVGGTVGSQLLMVLAAPLLTRLFTPEDFGVLAVYAGLLALFTVIASLRYELAIPLPEDTEEAASVVVLCLLSVTSISLLSGLIVLLAGKSIATLLGVPALADYFWLLPVGVLFAGVYQVFNCWAIRNKHFPAIASTRIKQALTMLAIQLAGHRFGPVALLSGQAVGQGMGSLQLGRLVSQQPQLWQVRLADVQAVAKRYRHLPFFSTWSGLLNTAGQHLPSLMFAALFSPVVAGLYALANRVLAMPMSVVGSAIGNVLFANAAEAHREGRLAPLVASVHEKLVHIAMPPAIVLLIAGPDLFAMVFGPSWRSAGELAQWMTPLLYLVFITSPLSNLFSVLEKERQGLLFQALLFVVRLISIIIGANTGGLIATVALFSLGSMLCWAGFLVWVTITLGNAATSLIRPTAKAFSWALLCAIPLAISQWLRQGEYFWLLALASTSVLIAARFIYLFRKAY